MAGRSGDGRRGAVDSGRGKERNRVGKSKQRRGENRATRKGVSGLLRSPVAGSARRRKVGRRPALVADLAEQNEDGTGEK